MSELESCVSGVAYPSSVKAPWIPAFAGMTAIALVMSFPRRRESIASIKCWFA